MSMYDYDIHDYTHDYIRLYIIIRDAPDSDFYWIAGYRINIYSRGQIPDNPVGYYFVG